VRIYDSSAGFAAITSDPASYGITNVTVPACDAAKIAKITGGKVVDGSSPFCNATPGAPFNGIRDGADANTWLFADGVHPTTGGQRALGGAVVANLRAWGWIAP
jgi:phospholipase/lecithinase/hemolysin